MKRLLFLLIIILASACGGGNKNEINEHELYGKKRVDCDGTKSTNEAANVTQCVKIRPDAKEIKDTSDDFREDNDESTLRILKLPGAIN